MDITDDLDAIGLLCPLPVLKARKRLAALPTGALLRMQADDPAAIVDVPHYCHEAGHELVSTAQDGRILTFIIRKV
ncbi:sulfurtransferase TusA family protein [Roseitranquillus sediminis]|uniref:sulfurtransferase TusA family protein n=1 Tax=Roseitranquillus sediminis TaxID=2809051 RepID=UPI001D0C045A|nr:sulfurtransferase TusA family protein [Roseitranquillus sediminis]MBM9595856.1 sulfurtransferase TusA family protein [Roseitranquillus sediminis]